MRRYTTLAKCTRADCSHTYANAACNGTVAELEAVALTEARRVFGDARLKVVRNYTAGIYGDGKLGATITVEECE